MSSKSKSSAPPPTNKALDGLLCERLARNLVQMLKDGKPIAPSETIELVEALIAYWTVVDETTGWIANGLDELIEARANYSG